MLADRVSKLAKALESRGFEKVLGVLQDGKNDKNYGALWVQLPEKIQGETLGDYKSRCAKVWVNVETFEALEDLYLSL